MSMRRVILCLATVAILVGPAAAGRVSAQDEPSADSLREALLGEIEQIVEEAEDLGAKRRCPRTYTRVEDALDALIDAVRRDPAAARRGDYAARIGDLDTAARRLRARAAFIKEMRNEKHDWEAAAIRYDRLVESLATVAGIALPARLSGPGAGRALVDSVATRQVETLALIDSLSLSNRELQAWVRVEKDANETLIEGLRDEITQLRHRLWEMQLRAGVAEADRSAVEADITVAEARISEAEARIREQQKREEKLRGLADLFTPQQGEVLLTPDGAIHINLVGFKFASGSAWLNPRYFGLLDKVLTVADLFPGSVLTVEGHTDASGSRDRNIDLSRERADRIATLLTEKMGVERTVIEAVGIGPDRPVAPNTTPEGRARNRRIEIVITPAGDSP